MNRSDYVSESELSAERLARAIMTWWHLRGFVHVSAQAWPLPGQFSPGEPRTIWGVRSNLISGLPPGVGGESVAQYYRGAGVRFDG